jgi:hypothetical protein
MTQNDTAPEQISRMQSRLSEEMLERFPEIASQLGENSDLPYLQMHDLAYWLEQFAPADIPASAIKRVSDFWLWAQEQPPGQDGSDDIATIVAVGLIEKLFRTSATRVLLPHLLTEDQLIKGASYFKQWVGEDDYYKALELFVRSSDSETPGSKL